MRFLAAICCIWSLSLAAQARPLIGSGVKHARATIEPVAVTRTGAELLVTLVVDPGWHVSWRNPGETGLPTRLSWSLPVGVRAVSEVWPVPVIAHTNVGATHTLEGAIPWLVRFAVDSTATSNRSIVLTMKYGVCKDVCIPEQLTVQGTLPSRAVDAKRSALTNGVTARLTAERGAVAARRWSPSELCVDRIPLAANSTPPEIIADSGLGLDAAQPLSPASRRSGHGFVMKITPEAALRDGAKVLFVSGATGVAAHLDFARPAPGCARR
jgi:DsbC/DsbD-like thiol-disulfide interchange protein